MAMKTLISSSFSKTLETSIKSAIQTKSYNQIPNLLNSIQNPNPNIFNFLSSYPQSQKTQIIDEILQSFIHIHPRSLPQLTYSLLLSHILQNPNPFPLSLAILQGTLRSGCFPVKQTHLSLSSTWINYRGECSNNTVTGILSGMKNIGYKPDLGTCNYLLLSLCAVDQIDESVRVLEEMGNVGCEPDSESYGIVIGWMCELRMVNDAIELVKKMGRVETRVELREGVVVKLLAAIRANGEIKRAVEMIGFLDKSGFWVGFDGYEIVVKGCLEKKEFVLGGKLVMEMLEKGFIPHIRIRQRVLEGLVSIDEYKFACMIRQKLVNI
ncbi:hypothetical protein AQUCO_05100094v1 [Aquilegia coerulea]|uniref:Pentacotripeptide-repeat region of PRORP domain-containing protein n=1 Tax=Aquilegia coerulea TaxID=218851 RepID=A0A2G5CJ81_AQUCA|nr:hypothetical protein AQUCO_05100094v1 [Aquilegia coerulea]